MPGNNKYCPEKTFQHRKQRRSSSLTDHPLLLPGLFAGRKGKI